jgi:hypothetical protein
MTYKEEQFGWAMNVWILILPFLMLLFYLLEIGDKPMPLFVLIVSVVFFLIIFLLFFKLTVAVNDSNIVISFGVGIIRKKVSLGDIKEVKRVKTNWYNGWGIRKIKNGMLYNIQGFNAIELSFKNKKSILRIGIRSSSDLDKEIRNRITMNKS